MSKHATILRGAPLEGAALEKHLRAVSAECERSGYARLGRVSRAIRTLTISLSVLRARHDTAELTPAAQWLVDNARVLEEACVSLEEALRTAPALPASQGEARIDRFAREWISHTEGRATGDSLAAATTAWQSVAPLTEIELGLLPLAMRRALLMVLSDLASLSARTERERTHAEAVLDIAEKNRPDAYWERLSCLLQEQEDAGEIAKLDQQLQELGTSATEVAEREHDRQTHACLWVGNAIASLRTLSQMDWRARLESLSAVDDWLRRDPTGVYPRMDFASRSMYRRRVAKLAARFRVQEAVVARKALSLAEEGARDTLPELSRHIGYYLMDKGQPMLWKSLGKAPLSLRFSRFIGAHAAFLFVAMTFIGSTATTVLLWLLGINDWLVAPTMLVAGEGFRQLSGLLIHRLSPPRQMPRLAPDRLDDGGVLVAVPTLLTGRTQALEMVRHLSVLRLANPESKLSFMLLGDFKDGPAAQDPDDAAITDAALSAVKALNDVWNGGFYYLHRTREWNDKQKRYMGFERKRGALSALNDLLLHGSSRAEFAAASADPASFQGMFETVITLDADTQLPPGTALELAGMLQHPLTKPLTEDGKRRGCALIQPRMETSAATVHTRIARYWGGDGGFDPYITAFSDIYQNLCGEGSFAGKGVYDVRAFEEASRGKILENTVLSHDLLEGGLVGSSLACDVALYDSQPASLSSWTKRLHRWTRGDWQLLPWLIPWIKGEKGWMKNPLSMLNQYKIYDNLRRSLVPAASVLLIIAGVWQQKPVALLAGLLLPHLRALMPPSVKSLIATLTHIALYPYEALTLLDAAARTVWRVLFSRKHLLEWLPSHEAERQRSAGSPMRFLVNFICAGLLVAASCFHPIWFILTGPLALWWVAAPFITKWLDQDEHAADPLNQPQKDLLLDVAARTFRFFEETVSKDTHYLPPDNLQLEPPRGIAARTSPTNIGMYLVALVSAQALNLLDADTMARRMEQTVSTMEKMERWQGHYFNWYDTRTLAPLSHRYVSSVDSGNLAACLLLCAQAVRGQLSRIDTSLVSLPARLDALASQMDFGKLYDPASDLFTIGIHADSGVADSAHYDLMASEARLLSYLAVMRREVPLKHWRRLGRAMTKTHKGAALLSWSGTMFEYLLPALFLKSPDGTLLGDTYKHVALEQMGAFTDAPWGISESGYYAFDPGLAYQYKAFGMPRLALKTARAEKVIAPYASVLALSALPDEAALNIRWMAEMGWLDRLGFYEAADYNQDRSTDTPYQLVKSHMAHHQGMILASIANRLAGGVLTRAFHSLPQVEAYALLLEERKPTRVMLRGAAKARIPEMTRRKDPTLLRHVNPQDFPVEVQALYGGGTTMVVDARGGGYLSSNGLMLTRRRNDPLYDGGPQVYLRFSDGEILRLNKARELWFDRGLAQFRLEKNGLEAEMTCFVSPLEGAAFHLLRLHATPDADISVDVVSFLEVALSTQAADESHPAFQNLSIETARLTECAAIAKRRTRHARESFPMLLHAVGMEPSAPAALETSRMAFLGRGERLHSPLALEKPLDIGSGETGAVLDPCMSLGVPVTIEAGTSVSLFFMTAAVQTEDKARALLSQYSAVDAVLRALELSKTQNTVTAHYIGLDAMGELAAQRMASWLIAPLSQGTLPPGGRESLWPYAISGDLPVVLVRVGREAHLPLARAALKAHAYLRALGVWSDLVLVNEEPEQYHRPVRDALQSLLASGPSREWIGQGAGVHMVDLVEHGKGALTVLAAQAALTLRGGEGSLAAQLSAQRRTLAWKRTSWKSDKMWPAPIPKAPGTPALANGTGGFLADGSYSISGMPPQPWCNVLSNPGFGAVVTERGAGFVYHKNSRMRRVTPFASDPVRDMRSDFLFIRDEANGQFINPFEHALVTHGFGVSRFETEALGFTVCAEVFVDPELPVRCILLTIRNDGDTSRDISITAAARWQLGGALRDMMHIQTERTEGGMIASSPAFQTPAFLLMPGKKPETTGDGAWFFGANPAVPEGMRAEKLIQQKADVPCAVLRTRITLARGATEVMPILLGVGDPTAAQEDYRAGGAQLRLSRQMETWRARHTQLIPRLPETAPALMLARWLPYQALSSRIWAHAGFYQAGGAIGFRDQLQDMMGFLWTNPEMVRVHLLDAAAHQFKAGDVLHWWHPPAVGVRTRITDDRLFLPYVTVAYMHATGDKGILAEEVPYLVDVDIPEGHEDVYAPMETSDQLEPLHRHNLRALNSIRLGGHGIPLMGDGDWNDGMNGIGKNGRGESVWMGLFLSVVLRQYAEYCDEHDAKELLEKADTLLRNVEENAWDGEWYLRAWFDDGTALGGHEGSECRIDLLVQAWAVLAGAKRAEQAFEAALERLVDEENGIIRLLDPPFDGGCDPGYIRAYPPGIRENGGQYSHAACWFVQAAAKLGRHDLAWKLFETMLPTSHTRDSDGVSTYRVEPYVIAADVAAGAHPGRGGWTWYTGSAALLWTVAMEHLIGFEKQGDKVRLSPTAPASWKGFTVEYRHGHSVYLLRAERGNANAGWVTLVDDGQRYEAVFSLKT